MTGCCLVLFRLIRDLLLMSLLLLIVINPGYKLEFDVGVIVNTMNYETKAGVAAFVVSTHQAHTILTSPYIAGYINAHICSLC